MAATLQELLIRGFQIYHGTLDKKLRQKFEMLASHYSSIRSFLKATPKDFEKLVFKVDSPNFKLIDKDFAKIQAFQKSGILNPNLSLRDNFVKILTSNFVQRQIEMIDSLSLDKLNVNPILVAALNLDNETDLLRYYVYQAISRSIVTSIGFLVQELLLYAGKNIADGKDDEQGEDTKWDIIVESMTKAKTYLEIKSGPNDLNKTQILSYKRHIEAIEAQGLKAYIGETYGKRQDKTVTHGLYKKYLPNWESRTLIGRELWEFVSGTKNYHSQLMKLLYETSKVALENESFMSKIEKKIEPLTVEFRTTYSSYAKFLNSLW